MPSVPRMWPSEEELACRLAGWQDDLMPGWQGSGRDGLSSQW